MVLSRKYLRWDMILGKQLNQCIYLIAKEDGLRLKAELVYGFICE